MSQLNLSLPDDLSAWADSRVAEGRFDNQGAYLRELVRRDRDDEEKLARLQAAIDIGRASPISDRTINDIIADGRRRHATR